MWNEKCLTKTIDYKYLYIGLRRKILIVWTILLYVLLISFDLQHMILHILFFKYGCIIYSWKIKMKTETSMSRGICFKLGSITILVYNGGERLTYYAILFFITFLIRNPREFTLVSLLEYLYQRTVIIFLYLLLKNALVFWIFVHCLTFIVRVSLHPVPLYYKDSLYRYNDLILISYKGNRTFIQSIWLTDLI